MFAKKKRMVILLGLLCVILCVVLAAVLVKCRAKEEETGYSEKEIVYLEEVDRDFYPSFYNFVLGCFADSTEEIKVEPVEDYKDAVEKGLRVLQECYRNDEVGREYLEERLSRVDSIKVFYVPEENAWVLIGSCPCILEEGEPHWVGCHPVVILQSDGTVLAIGSY